LKLCLLNEFRHKLFYQCGLRKLSPKAQAFGGGGNGMSLRDWFNRLFGRSSRQPKVDYSDPVAEQIWLDEKEKYALEYLAREGVTTAAELSIEWSLPPLVSIWTIPEQGTTKTRVICGDLPTDYLREEGVPSARAAAQAFGRRWLEVAGHLLQGRHHPTIIIGPPRIESKGTQGPRGPLAAPGGSPG
jgi:hypothetical protein